VRAVESTKNAAAALLKKAGLINIAHLSR